MIETSLMVHDYPDPPEDNSETYVFKCNVEIEIKVTADDIETAKEYCNLTECDSYEIKEIEIEDYEVE